MSRQLLFDSPLTAPPAEYEAHLLSTVWRHVRLHSYSRRMLPWPRAGMLLRSLYQSYPSLDEDAAESIFRELPRASDGGRVATHYEIGYGRLWWPEPNRFPHHESVVGLTFAGLATVASTDQVALMLFEELMSWLSDLAAKSETLSESSIVDLHSLLPDNAVVPSKPDLWFPRLMFVQMLRQEHGTPVWFQDEGRHVDLGKSRLRAFRSVASPADYWEVLGKAVVRRMEQEHRMTNVSEEASRPFSVVHIGDAINVSGTVTNFANRNQHVTQENHVGLDAHTLEALQRAITEISVKFAQLPLSPEDAELVEQQVNEIRHELDTDSVRPAFLRRTFTTLKGVLAPFVAGVSNAVTEGTKSLAGELLELLHKASGLPF
ncbi:hypothetical protein [Leifsonia sp. SIMBA_070]|uniref:hypothetical protein n=1 Tax=Leifsonia sp. SIMBA_070 TaxID=3085810 RepID=UPI00397DFA26